MFTEVASIAASAALNTSSGKVLSTQRFSGLIVEVPAYATLDKVAVSVQLNTPEFGAKTLVPNFPLYPLVERADIMGGVGLGEVYVEANQTDAETENIDSIAACIDLGHIDLSGDDALDISFKVTTAFGAGDGLTAWAMDSGNKPERILAIETQASANAKYADVEELYLYPPNGASTPDQPLNSLTAGQCNVQLSRDGNDRTFDARAAYAATRALGQLSGQGTRRTALLYADKSVSDLSGTMGVNITGSQSGWGHFAVVRVLSERRARTGISRFSETYQRSRAQLVQRDASKLVALQVTGKAA